MSRAQAYVYDISQGMARGMSRAIVGKQVDIIPHTGIVVYGKEVFFGSGVCVSAAGQAIPMRPCEVGGFFGCKARRRFSQEENVSWKRTYDVFSRRTTI